MAVRLDSVSAAGARGLQFAVERDVYRLLIDTSKFIIQRMEDGSRGATGAIQTFGEALQAGLADRAALLRVHQAAAAVARENVLAAVERGWAGGRALNNDNPYRPPSRWNNPERLTGKLLAALSAEGVVAKGTEQGVQFMNQAALDATARHWRRLEYGAGAKGGGGTLSIPLQFDARLIKTLSLQSKPRPAFGIPPGFWTKGEGGNQFYVRLTRRTKGGVTTHPDFRSPASGRTGPGAFKPTKGIEAHRFFEAGLFALAADPDRGLSAGYTRLFNSALDDAKTKLGQALAGLGTAAEGVRIPYSTFGPR